MHISQLVIQLFVRENKKRNLTVCEIEQLETEVT